ncbi:hypothetical protein BY996DRAFT_6642234 [Phakopsora pachyrhizi]|nr:hypothetical protein BY996DRAFT_6642234 [Phakopsora pachyrhizi]
MFINLSQDWSTILAEAPERGNPFEYVENLIKQNASPSVIPGIFPTILAFGILTIIMTFLIVFLTFSLFYGTETRSKHLWLLRLVNLKNQEVRLIVPNSLIFLALGQLLSGFFTTIYLYSSYRDLMWQKSEEVNLLYSSAWFDFAFLYTNLALWISAWGYRCATLLIYYKIQAAVISPMLTNSIGLAWPLGVIAMSIYNFIKVQKAFKNLKDSNSQFMTELLTRSRNWSNDGSVGLGSIASFYDTNIENKHKLTHWRCFSGISQGIMTLVLAALYFGVMCSLHFATNPESTGSLPRIFCRKSAEKIKEKLNVNEEKKNRKIVFLKKVNQAFFGALALWSICLLAFYTLTQATEEFFFQRGVDVILNIFPVILFFFIVAVQIARTLQMGKATPKTSKTKSQFKNEKHFRITAMVPLVKVQDKGLLSSTPSAQTFGSNQLGSSISSSFGSTFKVVQPFLFGPQAHFLDERYNSHPSDFDRAERLL